MTIEYAREAFKEFAAGRALLDEVVAFYGPSFVIEIGDSAKLESHFSIDCDHQSLLVERAAIFLHRGEREKEALMHELFHLALPVRGYPIINSFNPAPTPQAWLDESDVATIHDSLKVTTNIAQHLIFFDEYIQAGLAASKFVANHITASHYRGRTNRYKGAEFAPGKMWIEQDWWSIEYFRALAASKLGDQGALEVSEKVGKYGPRLLPTFKSTRGQIREWVEQKARLNQSSYATSMAELFAIFGLPIKLQFCRLARNQSGPPTLVSVEG